jgi:hypothetical protein
MPMRSNTRKRGRIRRHRSELDWFGEDPWAEPDRPASEDSLDDWTPDAWDLNENELGDGNWSDEDEGNEDSHDGWGPIRPRRGRQRHPQ